MSDDRELLELAARAAGIRLGINGLGHYFNFDSAMLWNPLKDDGDALRLAVKLELTVYCRERYPYVEFTSVSELEMNGSDPCSATRRAIVRAAAEIGRQIDGGVK